jgi:hypothetical protein
MAVFLVANCLVFNSCTWPTPSHGLVLIAPKSPHLLVGHGSHTWVARRISILTFCRAMRLLSHSRWNRKTKAMSAPLMFLFVDFGLFHCQCFVHDINRGNLLR